MARVVCGAGTLWRYDGEEHVNLLPFLIRIFDPTSWMNSGASDADRASILSARDFDDVSGTKAPAQ